MSEYQVDELNAELVVEFLRRHPDFFAHYPELVERLHFSHQQDGAVSLVQLQLQRQRQRIEELEEEITTLMSLAAGNDNTFRSLSELQKLMLKSRTLADAIKQIETAAANLRLKAYVRLSEAPNANYRLDREYWQRFTKQYCQGKSAYLGRLKKCDRDGLFGPNAMAPEMGSYVVVPLKAGLMEGLIAFSSPEGGHFQPCMDTLFLQQVADVFTYLLETMVWTDE